MEISRDELEELIEKKVDERLKEREKADHDSSGDLNEGFSRRSFLKKAGIGVAGLGALGLSSASGLKLTGNGIFDSGSRTGVLKDSGTDTNGGSNYQLPNNTDNIDLQSNGRILNAGSIDTNSLTTDGGRIGGSTRLGQELLRDEAPKNATTTYDPKADLPIDTNWLITISTTTSKMQDEYDDRGFHGIFFLHHADVTARVREVLTVDGHGWQHTASVDSNGVITYGTTDSIGVRGEIVVSAIKMG